MINIQPANYNCKTINFKSNRESLDTIGKQIAAITREEVPKTKKRLWNAPKINYRGFFKRAKIILGWLTLLLLIPSGLGAWRYNYAKNSDKKKVERLKNEISLNEQKGLNDVSLLTTPMSKPQFIDAVNENYTDTNNLFKNNQVPIYIQELRKARTELYEQLPAEDKIVVNEIGKYLLSSVSDSEVNGAKVEVAKETADSADSDKVVVLTNGDDYVISIPQKEEKAQQKVQADPAAMRKVHEKIAAATGDSTVSTDTTDNFVTSDSASVKAEDIIVLKNIQNEIASKVVQSEALQKFLGIDNIASDKSVKLNPSIIKAESLAIIDALRALNKDGYSILTGANSDKFFNEACKEILKQYFNDPNSQIVTKKAMDLITSTRDKIEKDMTPQEKKIYQEKYNQYIKELNSSIYKEIDDTKNDKHIPSIVSIFIIYWLLFAGIYRWGDYQYW